MSCNKREDYVESIMKMLDNVVCSESQDESSGAAVAES